MPSIFGRSSSSLGIAQVIFATLALLILSTAFVGWLYVFACGIVFREEAPTWAAPLAEVSTAVSLALFGTYLGFKEMGLLWMPPQTEISIVRQEKRGEATENPWRIDATVSALPGKPPIRLRTLTGRIEPLYENAPLLSGPILLKPDPRPLDVVVERFSYLVEHVPLPPPGEYHRLTFFLVAEEGSTEHVVNVRHDGGWYVPGWRQRRKDATWLERRERDRRIKRKEMWRGLKKEL